VEDSDDGDDWFSVVDEDLDSLWGDGWETEELSGIEDEDNLFFNADLDFDSAAYVGIDDSHVTIPHTELYDSGTTCHLSPYHEMFNNFTEIPLRTFNAANNKKFDAIGQGDMVVEVPNGIDASKLQLTKVLYSPEVGYTLVSIRHLDDLGYQAVFGGRKCTIHSSDGKEVGQIPKNGKGLYKVVHEDAESSFVATEKLTIMEFHCQMGHILPGITKKLVENGLVASVYIDESSGNTVFCESCPERA